MKAHSIIKWFSVPVIWLVVVAVMYGWVIPAAQLTIKPQGLHLSHLIEVLVLTFFTLLMMIMTGRFWAAVVMTSVLYLAFITINISKIYFLAAPLMPIDFTQLDDLFRTTDVVLAYWPYLLLGLLVFAVTVVIVLKAEQPKPWLRITALLWVVVIGGLVAWQHSPIKTGLKAHKMLIMKNTNQVNRFVRHGFLNFFMQAAVFQTKQQRPEGYDANSIDEIMDRHGLGGFMPQIQGAVAPDNVILILAESFVDPNELGIQTNEPVLQHFNRLRDKHPSGHVVVPVFGGKSINSEFELLTGLSMYFTPIESLPSRELVSDHTPSIARVLANLGLESSVIQVVPLSGFGFEKIYDYVGIDDKYALIDEDLQLDPSGKYASSQEVAKQILAITEQQDKSFIYAFANSSHMPWHVGDYPDSQLALTEDYGLSAAKQDEVLGYFNALRHVETLLTQLVDHYQQQDENTLILMVGDHHPALDLFFADATNRSLQRYVVPALIWSNYLEYESAHDDFFISMNYLGALLMQVAEIDVSGFFLFNKGMRDQVPVVSSRHPLPDDLNSEQLHWLQDYEMLQYHILMEPRTHQLY